MAKEKLNQAQNIALKGLNLEEKLNLLHEWKKKKEITQSQFNFFSNHWISRESKKIIDTTSPLRKTQTENKTKIMVSVEEAAAEKLLNKLQRQINAYLADRGPALQLETAELATIKRYLQDSSISIGTKNRLIIIGLRYPDKRLNEICNKHISEKKKHPYKRANTSFWMLLWEDNNLVPMDAIRLMLKKEEGKYMIDPFFSTELIRLLVPMIEIQRDKEITRLKWAQSLEGHDREREVARKTRRLNAFNILLQAAHEYIGG